MAKTWVSVTDYLVSQLFEIIQLDKYANTIYVSLKAKYGFYWFEKGNMSFNLSSCVEC